MNLLLRIMDAMWDANSKKLLEHIAHYEPQGGAELLMLRHSKREEPEELHQLIDAPLTDEGRDGARRFAEGLPRNRRYQIYHSPVERCGETAAIIHRTLAESTRYGLEQGDFLFRIQAVKESFAGVLGRDGDNIINHWLAGHYPPDTIQPPLEFAGSVHDEWMRLRQAASAGLPSGSAPAVTQVFVSHDLHTAVCLYLWTGLFRGSEDMIEPMDGFLLEDRGNELTVITKDGRKDLAPPHWWGRNGASR
jgi:broad specificity phosphatase PhoE